MHVTTEANPQDILSQHYNQANLYFQSGEFNKALEELNNAKQYAADENQLQHIDNTIATIKENMGQADAASAAPISSDSASDQDNESVGKGRPSGMMILTILVGLVCVTPIVMKYIEIFSQPRPTSAVVAESTTEDTTTTETTDNTPAQPAAPEPTPAMIVNAEQPVNATVSMLVSGSNVNMRADASTKSARVTTLAQGSAVEAIGTPVKADGLEWQKIKTAAGSTGWIASQFLQAQAAVINTEPVENTIVETTTTTTPVATAEGTLMRVAGTGVSVRALPSTTGRKVLNLSQTQVTVLRAKAAEADGYVWSKIKTRNGTEGWIAHQFLSP